MNSSLPSQSNILVANSISAVSIPVLDLGSQKFGWPLCPRRTKCLSHRRYFALPAVLSNLLFHVSWVSCGKPFLNTELFRDKKSCFAYSSRLACSASSRAFLDIRLFGLRREVLWLADEPKAGRLMLGESLNACPFIVLVEGRPSAFSITGIARRCSEDCFFVVATRKGFLALFGSSLSSAIFRIWR